MFQSQQRHVDTTHHRSGAESLDITVDGPVPIRNRHSARGLVSIQIEGVADGIELATSTHRGNPHQPISLGEGLSVIERNTVLVEVILEVVIDLQLHVLLREEIAVDHILENHVVLEGPGVRKVVLKARVITVVAHHLEPLVVIVSEGLIEFSRLLITLHSHQLSIRFKTNETLDSKVDVVRRGAHEIISAELVTRIRKELDEVVRPLLEKRPVLLKVVEITRSLSHSEDELEHVTCLFHRHVLLVLSVGITNRPDTQVMRSPFEVITT